MGNMSYCRFNNTAEDLEDCQENMDDDEISEGESKARMKLIQLCVEIAADWGHELEEEAERRCAELNKEVKGK